MATPTTTFRSTTKTSTKLNSNDCGGDDHHDDVDEIKFRSARVAALVWLELASCARLDGVKVTVKVQVDYERPRFVFSRLFCYAARDKDSRVDKANDDDNNDDQNEDDDDK